MRKYIISFLASLLLLSVGHEKESVRFLKKVAGNSLYESGCQLTHLASRGELSQLCHLLTKEGINPNGAQANLDEATLVPLVAAARFGNEQMVQNLINHGADPLRNEFPNNHNFIHAAAQHGHSRVLTLAKELIPRDRFSILIGSRDSEGRTPLRLAAWQGNVELIIELSKIVKDLGLDIDQGDLENRSPLFAACYMQQIDVVAALISQDADPNRTDRDGRSPLNIAAVQNQLDIVHQLLGAGAAVNHGDLDGHSALHTACFEQHIEIVKKLIEFQVDVDQQDLSGISPLMAATTTGNVELVDILLKAGASLDFLDQECRNVLSIAAQQGHTQLVKKFLKLGLDDAHTDNGGWTPLHLVAAENHSECAQVLLETGANPDQLDNDGRSPLIIAAMEGHLSVVKCLLQVLF